jgi:hypothetical protein
LEWVNYRPLAGEEDVQRLTQAAAQVSIEVVDCRGVADPLPELRRRLLDWPGEQVLVWAEAEEAEQLKTHGLTCCTRPVQVSPECARVDILVCWGVPPGPTEWLALLQQYAPRQVCLFGVDLQPDEPQACLQRLAGLLRWAERQAGGRASLAKLAAALGQRPSAARAALDWLVARGHYRLSWLDEDELLIEPASIETGAVPDPPRAAQALTRLQAILRETAAYRTYFRQARAEKLLNP